MPLRPLYEGRPPPSYRPASFTNFGSGLNLRDAPAVVDETQALDVLNVLFTERGAVKKRGGYAAFTSSELTNQPDSLHPFYKIDGTKRLLVGNGNRLDVLDASGVSVANSVAPTASPHFFTRYGGPTVEAVYIANGIDQVRRYDTAGGFTTPAGLAGQTGKFLSISPWSDNRLVVARETGTTAGNNPSSVNFSDPGNPETFLASSYVDITPGDGEEITGICTWRELLFIFKETKFAVINGVQVDGTGEAVFNWRLVDNGIGLIAPKAVAAKREAVYFLSRHGVYRTVGGEPEHVSDIIDPFFVGSPSIYFKSDVLNHAAIGQAAMGWHDELLYVAVPTGTSATNSHMLVHDPRFGWWSLWDIPAAALATFRVGDQAQLVFAAPTGTNHVYRHSPSYLADGMTPAGTGGSAISARWRSGWSDLGSNNSKTIRQARMWAAGSVSIGYSTDFEDVTASAGDVEFSTADELWDDDGDIDIDVWDDVAGVDAWSSSETIATYLIRASARGTMFSTQFTNSTIDTGFSVHRFEYQVREDQSLSFQEAAWATST